MVQTENVTVRVPSADRVLLAGFSFSFTQVDSTLSTGSPYSVGEIGFPLYYLVVDSFLIFCHAYATSQQSIIHAADIGAAGFKGGHNFHINSVFSAKMMVDGQVNFVQKELLS